MGHQESLWESWGVCGRVGEYKLGLWSPWRWAHPRRAGSIPVGLPSFMRHSWYRFYGEADWRFRDWYYECCGVRVGARTDGYEYPDEPCGPLTRQNVQAAPREIPAARMGCPAPSLRALTAGRGRG